MAVCVIDLNTLISQPSPNFQDQHTDMGGGGDNAAAY